MSSTDALVIQRVRDGDTEAFSDLVSRYQRAVRGIAVAATEDIDEAEDLVQASFVEAFGQLGELRNGCRFGPWLYTIARNRCRDWLRGHSRHPLPASDPSGLRVGGAPGLPTPFGREGLGAERTDGILEAVAALPQAYRTTVVLRFVAELSYEEIGRALSLTPATARSRCHRAIKMLRERTCRETEDLVVPYIDGELSDDERDRFEAHLSICPDCRDRWQHAKAIVRDLREAFGRPPEVAGRVMEAVRTAAEQERRAAHLADVAARVVYARLASEAAGEAERLAKEAAPELYATLGDYHWQHAPDWDRMMSAFGKALELSPVQGVDRAVMAVGTGQNIPPEHRIELVLAALRLEPTSRDQPRLAQAVAWLDRDLAEVPDYERVLDSLAPLAETLDDPSYVHSAIATVELHRGEADAASRALDAASRGLAAETFVYWQLRAGAADMTRNREEALAACARCAEVMQPEESSYMGRVAEVFRRLDPEAAEAAWAAATSKPFEYRDDQALMRAGDVERAEQVCIEWAEQHPEWGLGELASFYLVYDRADDAEHAARRGIETCPPGHELHAWHQGQLASALALGRDWEGAVEHACRALHSLPGSAVSRRAALDAVRTLTTVPPYVVQAEAEQIAGAVVAHLQADDRALVREQLWPTFRGQYPESLIEAICGCAPDQRFGHWSALLELDGRTAMTRRARAVAARALAEQAPDRARRCFEDLRTERPADDVPWLGLYWLARDADPDQARAAAREALGRAGLSADMSAYSDLAEHLAETDPTAGLAAFAEVMQTEEDLVGPLALGYLRLLSACDDKEGIARVAQALVQQGTADKAEDAARFLSDAGHHREAVALIEHFLRTDSQYAAWGVDDWGVAGVFKTAGEGDRLMALWGELVERDGATRPDGWYEIRGIHAARVLHDVPRMRRWLEALDERPAAGYLRWRQVAWSIVRNAEMEAAAWILVDEGRYEEAMDFAEGAFREALFWGHKAQEVFGAAGEYDRWRTILEDEAEKHADDARYADAAAQLSADHFQDWPRVRMWQERATAAGHDAHWHHGYWAILLSEEGRTDEAKQAWDRALARKPSLMESPWERWLWTQIEAGARGYFVFNELCNWVWYEATGGPPTRVFAAAADAAEAGRWMTSPAEGLLVLAETEPDRVAEWTRRLAERYPDNPFAIRLLVALCTPEYASDPEDVAGFARLAITTATDRWDTEMVPKVLIACAEILLEEGLPGEALEAFQSALELEAIGDAWRSRAEQGAQQASQALGTG